MICKVGAEETCQADPSMESLGQGMMVSAKDLALSFLACPRCSAALCPAGLTSVLCCNFPRFRVDCKCLEKSLPSFEFCFFIFFLQFLFIIIIIIVLLIFISNIVMIFIFFFYLLFFFFFFFFFLGGGGHCGGVFLLEVL